MIVKMSKYTFVLYHERQKEFLAALQELGLVDITTTGWEANGEERAMLAELEQHRAAKSCFAELAKEDPAQLAHMAEVAQKIADQEFHGAFRLIFNTGIDAGQTVFHVHAHVLTGEKLDE